MQRKPRANCLHCGKPCKRATTKYCSPQCRADFFSKHGLRFGGPQRSKANRPCLECGTLFYPKQSTRKFCSRTCAGRYRWKHEDGAFKAGSLAGRKRSMATRRRLSEIASRREAKNAFSRCRGGYREDLKHYVRSTWEANVCRILNWFGVPYRYESQVLSLRDGEALISYRPDMITDAEVIEVKGWWTNRSKKIRELVIEQVPNLKITYVDEALYRELERSFGHEVPNWEFKMQRRKEVPNGDAK